MLCPEFGVEPDEGAIQREEGGVSLCTPAVCDRRDYMDLVDPLRGLGRLVRRISEPKSIYGKNWENKE